MERPSFQENTEVKVIDKNSHLYGLRGKVTAINGFDDNMQIIYKPYSPENYPTKWEVLVMFHNGGWVKEFWDWPHQLEPVQKKFIDIDYIREKDIQIGVKEDGTPIIRPSNVGSFESGDIIQISTKIDGANASIAWDKTTGKLEIFSRTNLLDGPGSLRGFYDYIKSEVEPKTDWSQWFDLVFFGEWCVGHTIKDYNEEWFNRWRVYDIWDKSAKSYLPQTTVKNICHQLGIEYIEELYYGPFVSWEHCRSFLDKSIMYGPTQEGIVIKNQTKLGVDSNKHPCYLKIVNNAFAEYQHRKKEKRHVDPAEELEKQNAAKLASTIITEARIKKLLMKLVDDGKLPVELKPTDMSTIMKLLPKNVFDDVLKEEKEVVLQLGKFAGKAISQQTANLVRKIVVGRA